MRLLLDESVPAEAASVLRDAGHRVATVVGRNFDGYGDEALIAACRREGWTLVTLDTRFAERTRTPADPRIVTLDLSDGSPATVVRAVRAVLPVLNRSRPPGGTWQLRQNGTSVDLTFSSAGDSA